MLHKLYCLISPQTNVASILLLCSCNSVSKAFTLLNITADMILRTFPSQARWQGETTASPLVPLSYDPDPACSLGNVGTQGILGMLSWSQRPFLTCSEVPAIFRDQHCKLPPEFLTRHRLPQWVSLCVPLVKTHSTPINLCIWLYRGRTQTGGVQVPKST